MSELLDRALELGHKELENDMKQTMLMWADCRARVLMYAKSLREFSNSEVNDPTVIIYIDREIVRCYKWIAKNSLLPTEPIQEFKIYSWF